MRVVIKFRKIQTVCVMQVIYILKLLNSLFFLNKLCDQNILKNMVRGDKNPEAVNDIDIRIISSIILAG